ncbi:hypothetical protein CYMTET_22065 [Cymbomonas tetramitiformis]|uniref:Pantothenate kinase n=1 Tax=Cymbomonas tetramitiformis TaxID=36881 RepID=A0AAE0G1A9_9CHLO|nr:hypothetical protein CYMTET_22065 [Cymbomonas tetramitiformis]
MDCLSASSPHLWLDGRGEQIELEWPDPLFPMVIVNMGSGVSCIRVDHTGPGGYERVGGTACGGATFLGLCKLLTSAQTFEEALELAEHGDSSRVDKLVGDIYGTSGCVDLGMPATHTAANFGKLVSKDARRRIHEEDLARSTLQMVVQASVVVAKAHMMAAGAQHVFFVGGFLENNMLAHSIIAHNMRSVHATACFLKHADFLGALGSLRQGIE